MWKPPLEKNSIQLEHSLSNLSVFSEKLEKILLSLQKIAENEKHRTLLEQGQRWLQFKIAASTSKGVNFPELTDKESEFLEQLKVLFAQVQQPATPEPTSPLPSP
ncbi:MAG: hypothetical protein KAT71_04690 [Gammaproteobacteria bacterium]|nr:hypothetical protein [Gammaproteobacteria bacterium]